MPPSLLPVPHHRQSHDYQCVPACVRMVLAYLGVDRSEDEIAALLGTSEVGTRARHIPRVQQWGLGIRYGAGSLAELQAALARGEAPVVFLWAGPLEYAKRDGPHAVVLGIDGDEVFVNDPFLDTSPQQCSRQALLAAWAATDHLWAILTLPSGPVISP